MLYFLSLLNYCFCRKNAPTLSVNEFHDEFIVLIFLAYVGGDEEPKSLKTDTSSSSS